MTDEIDECKVLLKHIAELRLKEDEIIRAQEAKQ